jgi:RNA polymerase sigma-70 factor (ECF subfamily)
MWLEAQISTVAPQRLPLGAASIAPEASCENLQESPALKEIEAVFRADLRLLHLIVRRVVRSASDAEDIVQDAFLRVLRAVGEGTVRSARAVLFKTAYNLALNHLRDRRLRETDQSEAVEEPVYDAPSVEETLILTEDMRACREAFDLLPMRCKQALSLRVIEELSYKEMSDRLGLSVSTLEKHYIRGRRLCRSFLESEAIRPPLRTPHMHTPVLAAAE